jgi:hypothetical protein
MERIFLFLCISRIHADKIRLIFNGLYFAYRQLVSIQSDKITLRCDGISLWP